MTKPHKHAEFIKAWADGAEIQFNEGYGWRDVQAPVWFEHTKYRIKPQPKLYQQRVEIPTPLTVEEALKLEYVWTPYLSYDVGETVVKWGSSNNRGGFAKLGIAYATKGEAQTRLDAMLATEKVC